LHGFRSARGPLGFVCHGRSFGGFGRHGRSPRGGPAGLLCHGFRSPGGFGFQGRSARGGPAGLFSHGLRSPSRRGGRPSPAGFGRQAFSRSRSSSDQARSGRFFFLKRSRG